MEFVCGHFWMGIERAREALTLCTGELLGLEMPTVDGHAS